MLDDERWAWITQFSLINDLEYYIYGHQCSLFVHKEHLYKWCIVHVFNDIFVYPNKLDHYKIHANIVIWHQKWHDGIGKDGGFLIGYKHGKVDQKMLWCIKTIIDVVKCLEIVAKCCLN